METEKKIEIAERLIAVLGKGKMWTKGNVVRIYLQGWATIIDENTVDINYVKRADFMAVKAACAKLNLKATRL